MIDVVLHRIGEAFIEWLQLLGAFDGFEPQLFGNGERSRSVVGGFHRLVMSPRFGVGFRAEVRGELSINCQWTFRARVLSFTQVVD